MEIDTHTLDDIRSDLEKIERAEAQSREHLEAAIEEMEEKYSGLLQMEDPDGSMPDPLAVLKRKIQDYKDQIR